MVAHFPKGCLLSGGESLLLVDHARIGGQRRDDGNGIDLVGGFEHGDRAQPMVVADRLRGDVDRIEGGTVARQEVADATVFLASPLSSSISGQSLVVDGGATAVGPFPTR